MTSLSTQHMTLLTMQWNSVIYVVWSRFWTHPFRSFGGVLVVVVCWWCGVVRCNCDVHQKTTTPYYITLFHYTHTTKHQNYTTQNLATPHNTTNTPPPHNHTTKTPPPHSDHTTAPPPKHHHSSCRGFFLHIWLTTLTSGIV